MLRSVIGKLLSVVERRIVYNLSAQRHAVVLEILFFSGVVQIVESDQQKFSA